MESGQVSFWVQLPILIWFLNIVLVLGSVVLSSLLKVWLRRGDIDFYNTIQKFKYPKNSYSWEGDVGSWFGGFIIVECLVGAAIATGISSIISNGYFGAVTLWVVWVLLVIFAPRFIIDLCKGLKFDNKTGNLDKINDLQKQIDELKKGV